jgi:hypothetical protein
MPKAYWGRIKESRHGYVYVTAKTKNSHGHLPPMQRLRRNPPYWQDRILVPKRLTTPAWNKALGVM